MMKQVILITGARRGLGNALVRRFVSDGHQVVALVRPASQAETGGLHSLPNEAVVYEVDVAEFKAVSEAVSDVVRRFGSIDILFNNAAVYPKTSFLTESPEEWSDVVNVNLNGMAFVLKTVLPHMIQAGEGKVYNLGSYADVDPIAFSAAYSATKGAVHALTKAVAADIHKDFPDVSIEIHEWIPGHLKTRMSEYTGLEPSQAADWAAEMIRDNPSRRSTTYVNDKEWIPPKRLKDRLKDKLLFWRD